MTEILTESFCERCGTRYTFETARPQNSRLGRARTFTKGLRNYVLSDDSFSEAMADARGEEELAATVVQLDAFHKTFNFCLSCRQYTCSNCWHTEEGRCLSCAPRPGDRAVEDLEPGASEAIAGRLAAIASDTEAASLEGPIAIAAWPAVDLPAPEEAERAEAPDHGLASVEASASAVVDAAPDVALLEAAEAPTSPGKEIQPEAAAEVTAEPAGPAPTPERAIQGLRLGESLDDAIAAYEAAHEHDSVVVPSEAAPVAGGVPEAALAGSGPATGEAAASAVEPASASAAAPAPTPEALAADVAAAPVTVEPPDAAASLPAAALPEPAAELDAPLAPPPPPDLIQPMAPAAAPAPEAPQPIAATAAPVEAVEPAAAAAPVAPAPGPADALAPGWLTVAPDDGSAPEWPRRPSWPVAPGRQAEATTIAGRRMVPSADAASMWAASAREVMEAGPSATADHGRVQVATPTPQPCVQCGLSLSANARFCRRCGARQG